MDRFPIFATISEKKLSYPWILVVTSAETLRREEYEDLTEQMLKFDEDVAVQMEMQVKFKRAFEQLQTKQIEHSRLIRQLNWLKVAVVLSSVLSIILLDMTQF